eukprot:Em0007g681a
MKLFPEPPAAVNADTLREKGLLSSDWEAPEWPNAGDMSVQAEEGAPFIMALATTAMESRAATYSIFQITCKLLPQVLDIDASSAIPLGKGCVLLVGLYAFYLLEFVLHSFTGHSHLPRYLECQIERKQDLRIPITVWEDVEDSCTTSGNLEKLSSIKRSAYSGLASRLPSWHVDGIFEFPNDPRVAFAGSWFATMKGLLFDIRTELRRPSAMLNSFLTNQTAPKPYDEASVDILVATWGLYNARVDGFVISCFRAAKARSCFGLHYHTLRALSNSLSGWSHGGDEGDGDHGNGAPLEVTIPHGACKDDEPGSTIVHPRRGRDEDCTQQRYDSVPRDEKKAEESAGGEEKEKREEVESYLGSSVDDEGKPAVTDKLTSLFRSVHGHRAVFRLRGSIGSLTSKLLPKQLEVIFCSQTYMQDFQITMISIAALFLVFLADVRAMPGGAPPSACASISPQPGHGGSSQLVANSPYSLNVSQLTAARGYIPGSTYTLVLTGGAMQYKGLLVQGRSGSNPVGSFAAGAQVQPACASNTAVTHIDRSVKNNVQLTWTAPAAGTGSVVFSYAVVVQNDMNGNTYYATLTSPAIAELAVVSSTSIPCK